MSGNGIGDPGACELARAMGHLAKLSRLVADLRGNLVGDNGERELARAVGDLPKLERLELRLGGNCRSSGAGPLHHELKNAVRKLQTGGCICDFSF